MKDEATDEVLDVVQDNDRDLPPESDLEHRAAAETSDETSARADARVSFQGLRVSGGAPDNWDVGVSSRPLWNTPPRG